MRRAVVIALLASILALAPSTGSQAFTGFTFYGSGWGHGLGMSQYGAYGLAREGWTHQRILRHYYWGTTVGRAHSSPATLRIGLVQEATSIHVEAARGSVRLRLGSPTSGAIIGGRAITSGKTWSITPSGSGSYRVADDKGKLVWRGGGTNLVVGYLSSGGRAYIREAGHTYGRGYLAVESYSGDGCGRGSCLRVVAVLSSQGYLDGLGEVPSSWPAEALMAQADAARTYAFEKVARLGQHRPRCDCGLYASTWDQAYIGWDKEAASSGDRWVSAVARTSGEVVLYHGAPIQAYYTSSSGGFTESNQNVWGGSPVPYLRGTCDPGDYTTANPNRTWRVGPLSAFTVTSELRPFTGAIGTVTGFTQIQRGVSGRIVGLTVVGTSRGVVISGSTLKWALGLRDDRVWINVNKNVTGHIRRTYDALSCAPGLPTGPQLSVAGGRSQQFVNGVIYWSEAKRHAYWLHGPVLGDYLRAGGPRGYLGLPVSDVMASHRTVFARFGSGIVVTCPVGGACYEHAPADLSIAAGGHRPAVVGTVFAVTLTVTGHGPASALAKLVAPLPAGATLVSVTATRGSCAGSTRIECQLGRLAKGQSVGVTIRMTPLVAGPLVQKATVSSADSDPKPANNSVTVRTSALMPGVVTRVSIPWFQARIGTGVSWSPGTGIGSGLVYEVRYRSAPLGQRFGPYRLWKRGTVMTSDVFRGRLGMTDCFSARARDREGHRSAWSAGSCSAVPVDDIGILRGGGWTRNRGDIGFYRGTSSASVTAGAWLEVRDVKAKRLALLVQTCPGCGIIGVYWNGTLLRKVSLDSSATRLRQLMGLMLPPGDGRGTLRVKVLTDGRPVLIDGICLSPV
jgi:SpoIID/LytB domain protein